MQLDLYKHPEYPDIFLTSDGRVFKELPVSVGYGGYAYVHLTKKFAVRVHTLILETFKGLRTKKQVARHLDGNPSNNSLLNLTWGTQQENCADTVVHGKTTAGSKNKHSKLKESQVLEIRNRRLAGECLDSIAKDFNVSVSTVCGITKGNAWKHI